MCWIPVPLLIKPSNSLFNQTRKPRAKRPTTPRNGCALVNESAESQPGPNSQNVVQGQCPLLLIMWCSSFELILAFVTATVVQPSRSSRSGAPKDIAIASVISEPVSSTKPGSSNVVRRKRSSNQASKDSQKRHCIVPGVGAVRPAPAVRSVNPFPVPGATTSAEKRADRKRKSSERNASRTAANTRVAEGNPIQDFVLVDKDLSDAAAAYARAEVAAAAAKQQRKKGFGIE